MPNKSLSLLAGLGLATAALFTAGCCGSGRCSGGSCSVPAYSASTYSASAQGGEEVIVQEPTGSSFAPTPVMQGSGSR